MKSRIVYKAYSSVIVLLFVVAIYVPFLVGVVAEDKLVSQSERRSLAMIPAFPSTLDEIKGFPQAFNDYYADHFGFREKLNKRYFRLVRKIIPASAPSDVTFGENGWMFLGSIAPGYTRRGDPMGDVMNVNLYTAQELEDVAASMMRVKSWLGRRGVEYIFVIAPNKHTVYFERLPRYISKMTDKSATDQLVEYLTENTDIDIVDLRHALIKSKGQGQLYFKTDTHWNSFGANVAQFEITKKVEELFPGEIKPTLLAKNQFRITAKGGGDLAGFADVDGVVEENPKPVFENTCDPRNEPQSGAEKDVKVMVCDGQRLNVLVYRDSFFTALTPYISRKFKRSMYLFGKISYPSLAKYVQSEKPDVVIEEWVERNLPHVYGDDFFSEIKGAD